MKSDTAFPLRISKRPMHDGAGKRGSGAPSPTRTNGQPLPATSPLAAKIAELLPRL